MPLEPADKIHGQARSVGPQDPCPSCKDHPSSAFEDRSLNNIIIGKYIHVTSGLLLDRGRGYGAKLLRGEGN
jgi:hypothetical protein